MFTTQFKTGFEIRFTLENLNKNPYINNAVVCSSEIEVFACICQFELDIQKKLETLLPNQLLKLYSARKCLKNVFPFMRSQ